MEMVGLTGASSLRELAVSYLNDAKIVGDASTKTSKLKLLKEVLLHRDPSLLTEFVPHLMELQTERPAPIRNFLLQMIEEIGLKHLEHLPTMVPVLLTLMGDDMPAIARRAISAGSNLFQNTFQQVALQGIYSGKVDGKLEESWVWMVTLKDAIYVASQEHKNDGVRLLAIKFIEIVILLFTPEPNGPAQPPPVQQKSEKHLFNVAWLLGTHPILDVASLGQEASRNLSKLLDQLRTPETPKVSGPIAAVLVNSLVSIAKQRPTLYGRVLPVLLGLVASFDLVKGVQMTSLTQALKNAFVNLLKCTHSASGPWRERLVSALKVMQGEDIGGETATCQTDRPQLLDRKRVAHENGNLGDQPGKRLRSNPDTLNSGLEETQLATSQEETQDSNSSSNELSPLQQMIVMIGALVSKGDHANSSIDLLVASLSPDMLADIVIENMRNLPANPPAMSPGVNADVYSGLTFSLGFTLNAVATLEQSFEKPSDRKRDSSRDPRRMDPRLISADVKLEEPMLDIPTGIADNIAGSATIKKESFIVPSSGEQIGFIPGISQIPVKQEPIDDVMQEPINDLSIPSVVSSSVARTQGLAINLSSVTIPSTIGATIGPVSNSVELIDAADASDLKPSITALSTGVVTSVPGLELKKEAQVPAAILPTTQATIPVISMDISQQKVLWKVPLRRILENYKQVGSGGGCELRLSLLPRLILGSDEDDETWGILKKHILEDYQNHKGHELTIYTLYQLFAKRLSKEDPDSIAAASAMYDNFLLSVAEGLRDTLPPSDKSLGKLLSEAPDFPLAALDLLQALCNPDPETKDGLESPVTERITQGLSAVWSLILLRPPIRSECLNIALQCTVHELEEVRTKAIRLVANKLYPLTYISQDIEDFATKMLHTVLEMKSHSQDGAKDMTKDDVLLPQTDQMTDKVVEQRMEISDQIYEEDAQKASKGVISMQEAQRCMSLYFALCTKKNSFLREVFTIYKDSTKAVKQAVHKHMPVLIRTIGPAAPDLLQIISDPPPGSKTLVLLVLHELTESSPPSPELIAAVKQLYETMKDAKVLTPILSSLSKEEVLPIFPQLVALPSQDFRNALDRILQGSVHIGPALTPAEVLILIHGIDPERDHIPLSTVKDACTVCFQQRTVFTQQVLAKVLNQLVEQTPLPMLFMRTVILAVGSFRSLVSFVMEILSRLVNKQIWKWPNLWIGFLKCAEQTQPHSFHVLLQLPALQLEKALSRHPNLRPSLTAHAAKPNVRSTLPRSSLVVLGLAQDTLPSEASSGQPENSTTTGTNADTEAPTIELPAAT